MWEIFEFGSDPYPGFTNPDTVTKVLEGYRMAQPANCSETVYKLMLKTWKENPEDRPTFADCYEDLEKEYKKVSVEDEEKHFKTPIVVPQSENYN